MTDRVVGGPRGGDRTDVDVVVVGGGHNGLVAAALLARAGLSVRVLERRGAVGGFAARIELRDGLSVPIAADDWGLLRTDLLTDLGLPAPSDDPDALFALAVGARGGGPSGGDSRGQGGAPTPLWRDVARTSEELAREHSADGPGWRSLVEELALHGERLEDLLRARPSFEDLGRALGRPELVRALALPVADRLRRHLRDGPVASALATIALAGSPRGPSAAGTGLLLQTQLAGGTTSRLRPVRRDLGGEPPAAALARAVGALGGKVETGRRVVSILTERGVGSAPRAHGVRLADGEEIRCRWVLSNLDPRSTLLGLVGVHALEVSTVRELRAAKFRGSRSRLALVVEDRGFAEAPAGWLGSGARLLIGSDLRELDRAADAAKYGRCSEVPALEVFETSAETSTDASAGGGLRALLVNAQWSPFDLRPARHPDGWDATVRRRWQEAILARLEEVLPALGEGLLARRLLTPADWETEIGASGGSDTHGDMGIEQMFAMRGLPLAGGGPATGIEGLLLCGAGAHPGGGLTGLPGWHAACAVLDG